MKVFVSQVDTAIGHNLSRILSKTVVGFKKGDNAEEVPEGAPKPVKETYSVYGSLAGYPSPDRASNPRVAASLQVKPGHLVETGNKAKDEARREAIEKIPTLGQKPKWVKDIYSSEELEQTILSSDVIVYDLVNNLAEANQVLEFLSEKSETFTSPKTFIGISTVATWGKTKTEEEAALTEEDYRRRKPLPNFKDQTETEKLIVKLSKKSNIKAYVICPGLIYHPGDSIFHYLYKAAWLNEPVSVYGDGSNYLPTIYLDDLVSIIVNVIELTPEAKYIVAVDESKTTLGDITKAISDTLGGTIRKAAKEEAFLDKGISQEEYDMLTLNLKIDSGFIKEAGVEWKCESGIIENIEKLVQEFKDSRGFWPIQIFVHGPPASGKSYFSSKLVSHYKLHVIEPETILQETVARLEKKVTSGDEDISAEQDLLNELNEAKAANKFPSAQILNIIKEKLHTTSCKNQGFVLDGYPFTTEEAKELFRATEEDAKYDSSTPEFIFSIQASDEFIKSRMMKLPEASVSQKHTEEVLSKRLEDFRKSNTDENTILNYFDEFELHPVSIPGEKEDEAFELFIKAIGEPRNYGASFEELEQERKVAEENRKAKQVLAEAEKEKLEAEAVEQHERSVAEWNTKLEQIRKQEKDILEAQSAPLRAYLMKNVMPVLSAGLIEVSQVRPEDPIDYLAEYLFKHNPINN